MENGYIMTAGGSCANDAYTATISSGTFKLSDTKRFTYDTSRHDQPLVEANYANGEKIMIFKALGINEEDIKTEKIWIEEERVYCISVKGEYTFRDKLDFSGDADKTLYESKLDVRETVDPHNHMAVEYELKNGLLVLYFRSPSGYKDYKKSFDFRKLGE